MEKIFRYNEEDIKSDFDYNYKRLKASWRDMSKDVVSAYVTLLSNLATGLSNQFVKRQCLELLKLLSLQMQMDYQAELWDL